MSNNEPVHISGKTYIGSRPYGIISIQKIGVTVVLRLITIGLKQQYPAWHGTTIKGALVEMRTHLRKNFPKSRIQIKNLNVS